MKPTTEQPPPGDYSVKLLSIRFGWGKATYKVRILEGPYKGWELEIPHETVHKRKRR